MSHIAINPNSVRDIAPNVLDQDGQLKLLPASYWQSTSPVERLYFGVRHGLYCFPTVELIDWLRTYIGDRLAIEVGSGRGHLARALGITGTDNWLQARPDVAQFYASIGQPVVTYGEDVEKLDALEAAEKHKPDVIIAAWLTHKFDPLRAAAGGNEFGVDEADLIQNCDEYVFIGNAKVHAGKSIWALPHDIYYPEWLYSRAANGTPDFIAVWKKAKL